MLLSRCTHPKLVQRLLGHASNQVTRDRYSHWILRIGRLAQTGCAKSSVATEWCQKASGSLPKAFSISRILLI